jgi:hypothetical protein
MKKIKLKSNKEESDLEYILNRLQVNKFKLDEEAVEQVNLMEKACKLFTKAKDASLRAKNRMEIVEFEVSQKMRKNPKAYELEKCTDTVIYKAVKADPNYIRAFNAYCFAKKKEDDYSLLLDNVRSRGYSIKYLLEMWLNNYYVNSDVYVTKKKKAIRLQEED